uniref:UDENN domain-containing protein n=1 Tax=Kalanchoe fedtschenkoi TaxID=63787 RepID=A0A7N1A0N7_KALFE
MDVNGYADRQEEEVVSLNRVLEEVGGSSSSDGDRGQAFSPPGRLALSKGEAVSPAAGVLNNLELLSSPNCGDQPDSPHSLWNLDQASSPHPDSQHADHSVVEEHKVSLHLEYHRGQPSSPQSQVANILDLPYSSSSSSSSHQESEDVDLASACCDSLSASQLSSPQHQHSPSLGLQQTVEPSSFQQQVAQKVYQTSSTERDTQHAERPSLPRQYSENVDRPSSPYQDSENADRPSSPPDTYSPNKMSSGHPTSQPERKRPTLELQVSRHVNKPSSPLRIFQHADQPPSPYQVLQHISEETVRAAGGALHTVYANSPSPVGLGHRRNHSEIVNGYHKRSNSFQRFKSHMQKALRWGSNLREEGCSPNFNPEILANEKRQWYQLHSRALDYKKFQEPNSLFEHFIIIGLHSDTNLDVVEEAFVKRKKWELEMARSEVFDFKTPQNSGPTSPTLEPQILFRYPPGKKLGMRLKVLASFCFPEGVKARILERTPSLSDLNELVYGQEHLARDDLSFIFSLKSADNATMYGVCLHIPEIVQRPPGIVNAASPMSQSFKRLSRYLVSAPRCYCVLTRVPFFELHYELLNSIIAQERLNRITKFVTEMTLTVRSPSVSGSLNHHCHSHFPDTEHSSEWMASAISLDDAVALTAAAAGIIPEDEILSTASRTCEPESPMSSITAEAESKDLGSGQSFDDHASVSSEANSDSLDRMYNSCESGHISPEVATVTCPRIRNLEHLSSSDSLFSPGRGFGSEDDDDDLFPSGEKHNVDDLAMEWAKENKNDLLQIVSGYHALPVPARGSELNFLPLEHLQPIQYLRPRVSSLGECEKYLNLRQPLNAAEVNVKLAAAEEAIALSIWTTSTICRTLSLDSILALVTGVLLEKQIVVVCPNLGVLCATVLSLIPMIRPFEWQSLLLPVLPVKMLDFLDAPVPFIAGLQCKPENLKLKTSNLVHVNVLKDQVKMCELPSLPRRKELFRKLEPFHTKLACEKVEARRHPVHKCNEKQTQAAEQFLAVMRWYLESLCDDLRSYTITNVQANNDRVSILLKDSFIDSFPSKDQPFIKLFVDTQLFSVLSDFRLSTFEHE